MSTTPSNANAECVGPSAETAGTASGCAGCPNQAACASGEAKKPDPAIAFVSDRLSRIKHKILVLSGKGGVGKSTCSAQLAFALAKQGKQVGLLDIDICGPSIPRMLGLLGQEVHQSASGWSPVYLDDNLGVMSIGFMLPNSDDAVIWRGPRKNNLIKQFLTDVDWGELDYLIIDTPPGTSDEHISIVQYLKTSSLDGAVIVTTPQEVSMSDVRKEINFCKKTGLNIIGLVENMGEICVPLSSLEHHSKTGVSLVDSRGVDVTDSVLLRCLNLLAENKQSCPDLLRLHLKSPVFAPPEDADSKTPQKMATDFGIPFLGSIPMDPNMLSACEKGCSFLEAFPDSPASGAFSSIVQKVVDATLSAPDPSNP
ncbi:unnamed protein product [Ectocarpus fasciculatus]